MNNGDKPAAPLDHASDCEIDLTISSGAITVTGSYHRVDTECQNGWIPIPNDKGSDV
ncbi:MAG: hypothetical protein Unbinned7794contig1000_28 [Prokaryotic dsDNA virus sp.]|nr:MAG: hypothetical protein Unbinned7794contig1000_28 [Prokaryotic dsDNA virus sp.]